MHRMRRESFLGLVRVMVYTVVNMGFREMSKEDSREPSLASEPLSSSSSSGLCKETPVTLREGKNCIPAVTGESLCDT